MRARRITHEPNHDARIIDTHHLSEPKITEDYCAGIIDRRERSIAVDVAMKIEFAKILKGADNLAGIP